MLVGGVDDVLIDLVHDGVDVIFDAEVGDGLELVVGEDLAAGVGGVADQDGLAAGLENILDVVGVEVKRRGLEGDEHRLAVSHDGLGAVVFKVGGEHGDLVAGVGEGKDGVHHGLGGADGDDHVGLGIEGQSHEPAGLAR